MRPIKVEFQAFGPYREYQLVDFEEMSDKGLFLICGKTGIGKTMIIDAMTFALFGKSSGDGRGDLEAMRCTSADFKASTFVRFEFEHNGEFYRFERRLDRKTKNLSETRDASIMGEDGNWQTLLENAKKEAVGRKAEEIIGLDHDQFRQVIVLPQGQFEKLLTSSSNEKEEILTQIFGVDKWHRIAEALLSEASKRLEDLTAVKERIQTGLREKECETMEDLDRLIETDKKSLEEEEKNYAEANYEDRIGKLQEQLEISGKLAQLRSNLEKRKTAEKKATEDVPVKQEAAGKAEEALRSHLEKAGETEKLKEQKIIYEGRREKYLAMDAAINELEDIKAREASAAKAMEQAEKKRESSARVLTASKERYDLLDREHKNLMDAYITGIRGELARELVDGKACPVCGSTDHPNKAEVSAESVSKENVEAKKLEAEDEYRKVKEATDAQEKANEAFEKKKSAVTDLGAEVKAARTKLYGLKKDLIEGIETAGDLDDEIEALEERIRAYEDDRKTLEAGEKEAQESLAFAKEKVKTATREREDAARALDEATAERAGRQVREPDEIRTSLDEIRRASGDHTTRMSLMKRDIEDLEERARSLQAEAEGLEEQIRQAEEDVAFGKKLRGDTGTGLQRYVLGIMFSSVVSEANRMLEMVHGGRYRLFRTDDKGKGNKRGLELKVHDRSSDEHEGRFVGTLSGGEKFLAALALSIGMANVARKSGIGIDALFIDEGFGTLDEESIGDAMDILDGIQKAKGLVGIISHMQVLRDNIPTKLRVEGGDRGSHIVKEIG